MLLDRGTLDSAALTSVESNDVLIVPGAFDEVVEVLDEVHHLKYVGAGSAGFRSRPGYRTRTVGLACRAMTKHPTTVFGSESRWEVRY
ncbi:hypothetical protein [Rhodococcus opacus]|uniref:hypothetical protein n=1 Tax=Rhodococcus opacus TaxID=37919 RepID=UPI001F56D1E1|nr:hypothetical protein [Rhodococcus opacus]UNN05002.1 hypothetical protein MOO23_39245 [Rhodococcus opacus]